MNMQLDKERLITERNKRAWTQSHLAEVCDVSLRTIQRSEKSGLSSPETAKALASVYNLTIEDLIEAEEDIAIETKNAEHKANNGTDKLEETITKIVDEKPEHLNNQTSREKKSYGKAFRIFFIAILIILTLGYVAKIYNTEVHRKAALKKCGTKVNIAYFDSQGYSCKPKIDEEAKPI